MPRHFIPQKLPLLRGSVLNLAPGKKLPRDQGFSSGKTLLRVKARLAYARKENWLVRYCFSVTLCGCASNLQNGHAISRILTTPTYRIDLSIPKYHPGAHRAPQRNPISIFPSPSSPRTPHHPHPEPWRGTLERTRARQHLLHILARTLPFPTHSAAKQMAHAGAGFPPRRPVPGGRDGVWEQAGAPAHGHKKRALEHIQDP